MKVLTQTV